MIETAKDLIKKGKELGDPELIQMGHELLLQHDSGVDESPAHKYTYECDNCEHIFGSDKVRKACPECRKRKLCEVDPNAGNELVNLFHNNEPEEEQEPVEDGIFQFKNNRNSESARVRYDDDGNPDGTYTKSIEVNPNMIKRNFKKIDDEGLFREETETFTKKVKFDVRPRRPKPKRRKKTCAGENCNREFSPTPGSKEYLCRKCISRKGIR